MLEATASATEKKRGGPINIDFLHSFVHSSPYPGGDVSFESTPPAAARKGNAVVLSSPDSGDVCIVSPPSAQAKGTWKRRREGKEAAGGEVSGASDQRLRREIAALSDGELWENIAAIPTFGRLLSREKSECRQRLLPLLQDEARHRGIHTGAAKDGDDRCRNRVAPSMAESVYRFDIEDEQTEDASRKYFRESSTIRSMKKNYGTLGVQTRKRSNQTAPRKPITEDKMYSSKTSPSAFYGRTLRVRAVDPKEHDNENSRNDVNNYHRNLAQRRKAHNEGSSLLHQKGKDVVLLDDEDVQPDEPADYVVPDEWKDLKIYYPSSDDPEAVELSSSDIRCLNPGAYLSSPVINYYIQYIKRDEMHIEYGKDKFYMFNTYFYSKLQDALLDKGKFLKLRRWWKGVNIFQRGYIILPIHGTSHWSLIIVCMPAKESNSGPIILHLDSLAIHPSAEIFDTVGRYLEEEWRHLRKNPPSDISFSDTIWQDLPRNIQKEKVEVPGQNNAYDCGIFMLFYIKRFIREAPERFTRDNLDMFGRSWFRSEATSNLRSKIRGQMLDLFRNARVDDVMPEAAAPDGSDEACIIKEGEAEAVAPCGSSGMAVPEAAAPDGLDEECFITEGEAEAVASCGSSGMAVGGGEASTRDEEDLMDVISLDGTPSTTGRGDGRIGDCTLSEAATLSDSVKDDANDTMKADSYSSKTEQDIEILPSGSSKNNEEVVHGAPGPDYCDNSSDSDLEEVDRRSWKAKLQICLIS